MHLSPEDRQAIETKYIELVDFYFNTAREIIIAHERLSHEQKMSIPAIVELRSAFEHIMRVKALMYELVDGTDVLHDKDISLKQYCLQNIDKAHGHLYRAAYDAYDVIALKLADDIQNYLKGVSLKAAYSVVPDYNSRINKPYNEAIELVTAGKLKKDVGSKHEEQKEFEDYEIAAKKLQDVKETIQDYMPQIMNYMNDIEKVNKVNMGSLAIGIIGIVIGVIGVIITILGYSF